ncbi:MAG: hypothetical protein WEC73_04160 [Chthoniobacterales bacterium]
MSTRLSILLALLATPLTAAGQEGFTSIPPGGETAEAAPAPAAEPATGPRNPTIAGLEVPVFDPANDSVTWNGQLWQVDNNRLFRARFEKYLNAPATEITAQAAYDRVIAQIMDLLAAGKISNRNLDEAFKLLPRAASHEEDANLCDSIANQVLGAWQARRQMERLSAANRSLEDDRKRHEWNTRLSLQGSKLNPAPKNPVAAAEWAKDRELERTARLQPHAQRLSEVNALLNANRAKSELSALQSRIEFQALLVQLFIQRRFRHVLIGTRFYRSIFDDGDNQIRLGEESKSVFAKLADIPPTVTSLDTFSNEAIRDVKEAVAAVNFLLEKDELQSASLRLGEAFGIGEHLPEIHQFPRPDRQRILEFTRRANQLLSALEVKDYTRAEQLVAELQETAKDFDPSQPLTAVQTARNVSRMHLARARNAALSGDAEVLERELRAATEIWPNNPDLADVSGQIFEQTDVQQQALLELDRLMEQGDHRAIFRQSAKFIAAAALNPERQEKLGTILAQMTEIEGALQRAREIQQRGDAAGAWESIQIAAVKYPEDNEINRLRADLASGGAATFVQSLSKGDDLAALGEYGAALAWYLDAHRQYPPSTFAQEKIDALATRILPGSSPAAP